MKRIVRIESMVYRYPLATPIRTSFGAMTSRPMVAVRLTDQHGVRGIGEIWCNFPNAAAEHRAALTCGELGEALAGLDCDGPAHAARHLRAVTEVLAIQSGERNAIEQCIAGVDIAMHDLFARSAGRRVADTLSETSSDVVPVYASGINPGRPERTIERLAEQGFAHFKLKVGFGDDVDERNVAHCTAVLPENGTLAIDANQGWTFDHAIRKIALLNAFDLAWIEEPLRATERMEAWHRLATASQNPIAVGENLLDDENLRRHILSGNFKIIQPDIAKWGGFSACLPIARFAMRNRVHYFPHYLGGGIGLVASAHLLAAAGGAGMLEYDINENPLRTRLIGDRLSAPGTGFRLGEEPGLGVDPDLAALKEFETAHATVCG